MNIYFTSGLGAEERAFGHLIVLNVADEISNAIIGQIKIENKS